MKKIYSLVFLPFLIFNLQSFGQGGTWTQKAYFSGGVRYVAASFSIGAKGYVGTGLDAGINLCKDFWEYDTLSDTWTQKADFGGAARFGAFAFSIGNYGYVGLGTTSYPSYIWSTDFWQYDPTANTWTQKGDFPGPGRYGIASFAIGNKGYMGGGWDSGDFSDFWQYDPSTDTWTQKADIGGGGRESSTGFAINNQGYVTTGLYGGTSENDLWEYDTLADAWIQKASLPGLARYGATSFVLCNYAYVGFGSANFPVEAELNDFWRYDPSSDSWTQIANFPDSARNGAVDFVIGSNAYIGTGAATTALSGFTNGFWKFTSDSCSSVITPPPVADFQTNDSAICTDDCINFTDLSTNATAWQWSFPGATDSTSTVQNPQSVCYITAGIYDVTLIALNAAGRDSVTFVNYISVLSSPPTPVITQHDDTLFCSADTSYTSYQWYDDTTLIPAATNPFLIITHSGNYNLHVSNKNECSIAVGITVVLGIQNYSDSNILSLFPNPTKEKFTIYNLQFTIDRMEIYNVLGQVCQQSDPAHAGVNRASEISIDVSSLPSGIYFVQVIGEGERRVGRFVKE